MNFEYEQATLVMGLVSPFVGSFLGTLALRLPAGEPVIWDRSACDSCHHELTPGELVPLLSFAVQKGRCRACGAKLTIFYPIIELAALVVVLWAASAAQGLAFPLSCLLGWILLALAAMDARTYRLSDPLILAVATCGVFATWQLVPEQLVAHIIAGIAGGGALVVVAMAYRALRGRDGLGLGDAKLFGAAGLWVGPQGLISCLLLASLTAIIAALALRLSGRELRGDSMLPFGPFLALGLWLVWLDGPLVWNGAF